MTLTATVSNEQGGDEGVASAASEPGGDEGVASTASEPGGESVSSAAGSGSVNWNSLGEAKGDSILTYYQRCVQTYQ